MPTDVTDVRVLPPRFRMDWFRAVKKRQDIRRLRGRGPQARPRWFASSRSDAESCSGAATAESRSAESTTSRTCTCAQSIVPRKRSSCRISRCRLSRNTAPKTSYSSGPTCRRRYSLIRSAVESTGGPPGTATRESSAPRESPRARRPAGTRRHLECRASS